MRQIVAMGGGGFSMEPENPLLDDFVLSLAGKDDPRVCFVPTASGDSGEYIQRFHDAFAGRAVTADLALSSTDPAAVRAIVREQDVIYVGGGNTANLLAMWRRHGFDLVVREAYEAGVVLAGVSAGALCWFEGGVTDSFGPLRPLHDGLSLLPGSFCPHYDGEPKRRAAYRVAIAEGLPAGLAADDGAAAHFIDGCLRSVVVSRPHAVVRRVEISRGRVVETVLPTRHLAE